MSAETPRARAIVVLAPPDRRRSLRTPGVVFCRAVLRWRVTVFLDLDYLLVRDALAPERFVAIGVSSRARVLFVVHCERGEKLRIISARRATRREREAYERRRDD